MCDVRDRAAAGDLTCEDCRHYKQWDPEGYGDCDIDGDTVGRFEPICGGFEPRGDR